MKMEEEKPGRAVVWENMEMTLLVKFNSQAGRMVQAGGGVDRSFRNVGLPDSTSSNLGSCSMAA